MVSPCANCALNPMALLLKAIGLLLAASLAPCLYLVFRQHFHLAGAQRCQGVVVAHVPHQDSDGTSYGLQITYQDDRSQTRSFETKSQCNPPARAIGDRVTVFRYANASEPDVMVFEHLFFAYWLWFCIGLFALGWLLAPTLLENLYNT